MTPQEYRDLIDELSQMSRDLHACATDQERREWGVRADRLRLHAYAVADSCPRANVNDRAKMARARVRLAELCDSVAHLQLGDRKILGF